MTEDQRGPMWSPAMFAEQFQDASEEAARSQQELFKQFQRFLQAGGFGAGSGDFSNVPGLNPMGMGTATFKARVQSGGRISIPDAEREALDIDEGDIVQTIVIPVKRNRSDSNE